MDNNNNKNFFNKYNNDNIYNQNNNELVERIYDYGNGTKFHDLINLSIKKKKYRPVVTTEVENPTELQNELDKLIEKQTGLKPILNKNNLIEFEIEEAKQNKINKYDLDKNMKTSLLKKKFVSKLKRPLDDDSNKNKQEFYVNKNIKPGEEIFSITGFKALGSLPPSTGTRETGYYPDLYKHKTITLKEQEDFYNNFKNNSSNNTKFKFKYNKISNNQFNKNNNIFLNQSVIKPTTTIINMNNSNKTDAQFIKKKDNYYLNEDTNYNNVNTTSKLDNEIATLEDKIKNDNNQTNENERIADEYQYMNSINNFIKEAFEGKDYKINFVYYLPSNKENYYELRLTEFSEIANQKVYYTLSAKGLMVYEDKQPKEFIKLSEWIIEREGYNYVANISFFKNFKIWRIIKIWRRNIYKQKKIAYQNELSNKLLFNNPDYNYRLNLHKANCNKILELKILNLKGGYESNDYDNFIKQQENTRNNLSNKLNSYHAYSENIFVEGISSIFKKLSIEINNENNASNAAEINKKNNRVFDNKNNKLSNNKDINMINENNNKINNNANIYNDQAIDNDASLVGFETYSFKYKMKVKTECMNFIKLAYLFDYIILDCIRIMYLRSIEEVISTLIEYNSKPLPDEILENDVDKCNNYIRRMKVGKNDNTPYFLVKVNLENNIINKIEKRHLLKVKVNPFHKHSKEEEFKPVAHIELENDNGEVIPFSNMIYRKYNVNSVKNNEEAYLYYEKLDCAYKYFINYDPTKFNIVEGFKKQIKETSNKLKIKGWYGHPEFRKYLPYLGDYDDRFGDWDNEENQELDPSSILNNDEAFLEKENNIRNQVEDAYDKCNIFIKKMNNLFQLHWDVLSIDKNMLLQENIKDSEEVYRLLFNMIEKNIIFINKYAPFEEDIGMIKLDFEYNLRKQLIKTQQDVIDYIKEYLPDMLKSRLKEIDTWIKNMISQVLGKIKTPLDYLQKDEAKRNFENNIYYYEKRIDTIDSIMNLFKSRGYDQSITSDDIKELNLINSSKTKLKAYAEDLFENLEKSKIEIKEDLVNRQIEDLNKKAEELLKENINELKYFEFKDNYSEYIDENLKDLEDTRKRCIEYYEKSEIINRFLENIGESGHNFDIVKQAKVSVESLINLWDALRRFKIDYKIWCHRTKADIELDIDQILNEIKKYNKISIKVNNSFTKEDIKNIFDKNLTINNTNIMDRKTMFDEFKQNVNTIDNVINAIHDLKDIHSIKDSGDLSDGLSIKDKCKDDIAKLIFANFQNKTVFNKKSLFEESDEIKVEDLLNLKVDEHRTDINLLVIQAKRCNNLSSNWKDILLNYKQKNVTLGESPDNKECQILIEADNIVSSIEEYLASTNKLISDKFFKFLPEKLKKEIKNVRKEIENVIEYIDDWKYYQKKYIYLDSIRASFSNNIKIQGELNFERQTMHYNQHIAAIKGGTINNSISNIGRYMYDLKKYKLMNFKEFLKNLDEIQNKIEKNLSTYKEATPRFFFISSEDLLYMLSIHKSGNIDKIKPYLSKLFDDIIDLKFLKDKDDINNTNKSITALISQSKEELTLFTYTIEHKGIINTTNYIDSLDRLKTIKLNEDLCQFINDIERGMNLVLQMHLTSREETTILTINEDKEIKELITVLPSQALLTLFHINFTSRVEIAIAETEKGEDAIDDLYDSVEQEVKKYSSWVNDLSNFEFVEKDKNLSQKEKEKNRHIEEKNLRRTISNIITHHVHNRDIIQGIFLFDIDNIYDFNWQKVLRAYIEVDNNQGLDIREAREVKIKQLNNVNVYGYEYIGPCTRLVISGLTDKVWLTISTALSIKSGISLGGPAGTGKTETTKDLAKFIGYQCIVYNCSEQVTIKILGNLLLGVLFHNKGAFVCLDEFNRISVEVMSVGAQYMLNIKHKLLGYNSTVEVLSKEYQNVVGKMGVFITMNPTYAGRSELPDNLKTLFRPISMMIPDFQTISEVKLYSEGFSTAKYLAKKLFRLYELAGRQLSQQDHYDFTLRTVGSVLALAGEQKRSTGKNVKNKLNKTSNDNSKVEYISNEKQEELFLLNALKNANIPKFLDDDIKLFKALLCDLFPETKQVDQISSNLKNELISVLTKNKMSLSSITIEKSLQLSDILRIRLGTCLIGPAGSGKTVIYNTLSKSLTNLSKEQPDVFNKIHYYVINPKSITMGELFGQDNLETETFVYGIATQNIKSALDNEEGKKENEREEKEIEAIQNAGIENASLSIAKKQYNKDIANYQYWVVFDGPIDTIWIENLNSVLDDSMTLCLTNGERIKLNNNVKLMFEVEDLSQASLATVSRLGIIYVNRSEEQWQSYCNSWLIKYFDKFETDDVKLLPDELYKYLKHTLFEDKLKSCIESLSEISDNIYIQPISIQCAQSTCAFLELHLTFENGFKIDNSNKKTFENPEELNKLKKRLISIFALSVVWGVYACVSKNLGKVEGLIKSRFTELKAELSNNVNLLECRYNYATSEFVKYDYNITSFIYTQETKYHSIFIPTNDTIRYSNIIESLIRNKNKIFLTGESGVGKTTIIKSLINKLTLQDDYAGKIINFSASTTSEKTQESIEANLDKTGKDKYGINGKDIFIFIDDINMPEPNKFGSHPPIELLRQFIDNGGFYDRSKFTKKYIDNYVMVVSGGPPVGGRSKLTDRFNRQFTIINFPKPDKETLLNLYESILKSFFFVNRFDESIRKPASYVSATIDIYDSVVEYLKPIPSKYHYIYSVRDISRVIQGLLMANPKSFKEKNPFEAFCKFWLHENIRVFGDRLTSKNDYDKLITFIFEQAKNKNFFDTLTKDSFLKSEQLLYGELHVRKLEEDQVRPYEQIKDVNKLISQLKSIQEQYNEVNKTSKMNLNFFEYAIDHILRIARVLRQSRGSMMIIGNGGSGKQTLCKFASICMEYSINTITPTGKDYKLSYFRKDIKKPIVDAANFKNSALILTDNSVSLPFILEDINTLLNTGEIPNVIEPLDVENVKNECVIDNVLNNLHVLFCTSPVGDILKTRLRKFPALLNCCTIDWFLNWPKDALINCARTSFNNYLKKNFEEIDKENALDIIENLVNLSAESHLSVIETADRLFNEEGRRVYITPKSYLDMNNIIINYMIEKKSEADSYINKLSGGLKKLNITKDNIVIFEEKLKELEPILKEKEEKLKETTNTVNTKNAAVSDKRDIGNQKRIEVADLLEKADYENREISELSQRYIKELDDIEKEIKAEMDQDKLGQLLNSSYLNDVARPILEAISFAFDNKRHKNISFDDMKKILRRPNVKRGIFNIKDLFEKKVFKDSILETVREYLEVIIPKTALGDNYAVDIANFNKDYQNGLKRKNENPLIIKLSAISTVVKGFYLWLKGVINYWENDKQLRPLIENIKKLEEKISLAKKEEELIKDELYGFDVEIDKYKTIKHQLDEELIELNNNKKLNSKRMINAKDLVELLGGEGKRWESQLNKLNEDSKNFIGNMFLCSVYISYLSPFPESYRIEQLKEWKYLCRKYNFNISYDFSLSNLLSDSLEISHWNSTGLPSDQMSIDNAVIMKYSPKYCLIIDPQMQANAWLKNFYKKRNAYNNNIYAYNAQKDKETSKYLNQNNNTKVNNYSISNSSVNKHNINEENFKIETYIKVFKAINEDEYIKDKEEAKKDKSDPFVKFALELKDAFSSEIDNLVLIENIEDKIDPILDDLMSKNYYEDEHHNCCIKFMSDPKADFNKDFKLFLTTKNSNPHYPPEYFIKLTIINFTVTIEGLCEQLLSDVFAIEKETDNYNRIYRINELGKFNSQIKELEIEILNRLYMSDEKKILDDDDFIKILKESKVKSNKVSESVEASKKEEKRINLIRDNYKPIARRGSLLYFVIVDLGKIDPMYQYSLQYFKKIFLKSIKLSMSDFSNTNKNETNEYINKRVSFLLELVTKIVYNNIKRATFEKHKTLFSLLILYYIKKDNNSLSNEEWTYFLRGPTKLEEIDNESNYNNETDKISEYTRNSIKNIEHIYKLNNFSKDIMQNYNNYELLINSNVNSLEEFISAFPFKEDSFKNALSKKSFIKIILIKTFKPNKLINMLQEYISNELGKHFVENHPIKLNEVFNETDYTMPIIFLLSKGADPTSTIIDFHKEYSLENISKQSKNLIKLEKSNEIKLKEDNKEANNKNDDKISLNNDCNNSNINIEDNVEINNNSGQNIQLQKSIEYKMISLGQGVESIVTESIRKGLIEGNWVILNNCHLFTSWMPSLANILQKIKENNYFEEDIEINTNFRLWLTSMPDNEFPASILQNSIKLSTEPPSGIKNNLIKFYDELTNKDIAFESKDNQISSNNNINYSDNTTNSNYKKYPKIIFTLALFHSVLQERKKFGEIGFNKTYEFNMTDFNSSIKLISSHMQKLQDDNYFPINDIKLLVGELNYGGRVTDNFDSITLCATFEKFFNDELFINEDTYFDKDNHYKSTVFHKVEHYRELIDSFPDNDTPEIFGLNENAEIIFQMQENENLINNIIKTVPTNSKSNAISIESSEENTNSPIYLVLDQLKTLKYECPDRLDPRDGRHKSHEKTYDNGLHHSLTIVMDQEIEKYNKLINKIKLSLEDLKQAVSGSIVMSVESEEIFQSILYNKVPLAWEKVGYSSNKPLSSWMNDLNERITYIDNWIKNGHQPCHWISGLFYPKGFITGVLQNHARETKTSVSDIVFDYKVLSNWKESIKYSPNVSYFIIFL